MSAQTPVFVPVHVRGVWLLLMQMLLLMTSLRGVTVSAMLPYGSSAGDTGQTSFPAAIVLPSSFTFYGDTHNSIYASSDGFLTFTGASDIFTIRGTSLESMTFPLICIFCTDFEPDADHKIWTRTSTPVSDVQAVQSLSRQYQDFGATFTPDWVFVITWDDVGNFSFATPGNTLQLVLASDGASSLVLMEYNNLSWIEGFDMAALGRPFTTKVGFTKGDSSAFYVFPESESENLTTLTSRSNVGVEGQFLFRVDQGTITEIPTLTTTTTTTTSVPTTTTSVPTTTTASSASFDGTSYYVGFGVSAALLLLVGAIAGVVFKMKAKSTSSSRLPTKVAPAPVIENGMPPAAANSVLALGTPYRIPRPSSYYSFAFSKPPW